MIAEIINTGSELMLGRVLNTHQQWLSRQLSDAGYVVTRQTAIPDTADDIVQAVRESLPRARLIITTGGLGPTSDDLTRDAIARMLGKSLIEDAQTVGRIQNYFTMRNRAMPASTRRQASIPEGALVLNNDNGTAPGLAMAVPSISPNSTGPATWLIMLPGPPRELRPMFTNTVLPLLKRVLPSETSFMCRTVRSIGLGESLVEERLVQPLQQFLKAGLVIGYCARPGEVDVRLSARGVDANEIVREAENVVRHILGDQVFGEGDEQIEQVVVEELTRRKQTLALAESCTGGCIADSVTNVPGASLVFRIGFVTYSNEAKEKLLAVPAPLLREHGAVSEPVVRAMAEGARRIGETDFAIAVTGVAGPSGGSPDKPVGTVFLALATTTETIVRRMQNPWDRRTFKEVTAHQALHLLRVYLENNR